MEDRTALIHPPNDLREPSSALQDFDDEGRSQAYSSNLEVHHVSNSGSNLEI